MEEREGSKRLYQPRIEFPGTNFSPTHTPGFNEAPGLLINRGETSKVS